MNFHDDRQPSQGGWVCGWGDVVALTSFHTDIVPRTPFFIAAKRKVIQPRLPPGPPWA